MKWVLITTTGLKNPGDEFIRWGLQRLILEIDPDAKFRLLDKENPIDYRLETPFDKAVLCGMPLFWSHATQCSSDIHWWKVVIEGWLSSRKEDFAVVGAGEAVGNTIADSRKMLSDVLTVVNRASLFTVRAPIWPHPKIVESICPASFALVPELSPPEAGRLRVCNFMPDGGHDSHFNSAEAEVWRSGKCREVSEWCRDQGFIVVPHTEAERDFVLSELGWPEHRVIKPGSLAEYLDVYADAECYIGNRMHPSVLMASLGRRGLSIGYDSRSRMVERVGGRTLLPSQVTAERLAEACNPFPRDVSLYLRGKVAREREKLKELLIKFAEQ